MSYNNDGSGRLMNRWNETSCRDVRVGRVDWSSRDPALYTGTHLRRIAIIRPDAVSRDPLRCAGSSYYCSPGGCDGLVIVLVNGLKSLK